MKRKSISAVTVVRGRIARDRAIVLAAFMMMSGASPLMAAPAAGNSPITLSNDKPVAVSSDRLEVQQDKHRAIFSGNVIATQDTVNMRADTMVVYYTDSNAKGSAGAQGIRRIDATGNVIFTNTTDTAKGDAAVYDVEAQTLDLSGNVVLTRDQNVLKGTRMHYDLTTSRSVLTAGNGAVSDTGTRTSGSGRVHGLFVPNAKPKPSVAP